jgi:cation diffusion facilitator family transporter
MHEHSLEPWTHEHVFLGAHHARNERKTWAVIALCGAMMAAEIVGGLLFHSMALIADGLHMSTHAGALLIAAMAYTYARRHARDPRFAFGTGKLGDLAAFTSAVALALVALLIGVESVGRLLHPVSIAFREAIVIAALGLCVNLASAWLLRDEPDHDHHHADQHRDLNLRSAYVHVVADAAVSVLAIVGLTAGLALGWIWMDAVMGFLGAGVIANWSWGLIRAAGAVLLDMRPDAVLEAEVRARLERDGDRLADLHLWRVGPGHVAAAILLVSERPRDAGFYRARLAGLDALSHLTIEVAPCPGHDRQEAA